MAKITISQSELEEWFNNYLREQGQNRADWENSTPTAARQEIMYRRYRDAHPEIEKREDLEVIPDEDSKKEENGNDGQDNQENKGNEDNQGNQDNQETKEPEQQEEKRDRSLNSDENEFELDKLRVAALQDMGKVPAINPEELTPDRAIEIINEQVPELSDEELKDMEKRLTDKMLDDENEGTFSLMPPKLLAQKYEEMNETLASDSATEEEKQLAAARKEKLAARIDDLTDQFVDQGQTQDGLFFVDNTNIADVKEGYDAMFAARAKDLQQVVGDPNEGEWTPERDAAQQRISKMGNGASSLQVAMDQYEADNNIADLKPEDAKELDQRFEKIEETFKEVTLDDETMKLVSNFKFTNEQGEPEPQFEFEDENGNKVQSHEIPEGAKNVKIIEGSKLDVAVQLAKQDAMMDTLGTKEEITKESLQQKLGDSMTSTLFSMHTTSQVIDGTLENSDQFKDPKYLEEFKANLANPEKPMKIGPVAFEAGVDNIVNKTAGYATALGNKIGKDKPIVTKLFNPIENIDKRAGDRYTETKPSKRAVRIEMLKRTAKGAATAFVVSGAITTLGTMAATDATLTTATLGMNKMAGMALGVGLGIYATYKQLKAWNKQQTAEGKPKGFWNRCKQLLKDRKMAMTLGTTALGAAALGFAATGNPGVASALGIGAMALGTTNGVINNYQDCKKNGLGTLESCGWGAVMAAATIAGGFGGRATANAAIDWYNNKFPDNTLFQHKETTTIEETKEVKKFEEGTHEASEKTLKNMYTDEKGQFHEAELKAKIDGNLKFIDDNRQVFQDRGYDLNDPAQKLALAEKMELTKIALGENTGVNTAQHIDGGGIKYSHGNHYTMTDKVLAMDGFKDPTQAKADFMDMFNSKDPDAIARGMDSFEKINTDILGKHNEINYSDSQTMAGSHHDGVLHRDAVVGEDGKLHIDWEKGTEYNTYAEGNGTLHSSSETTTTETSTMVRNETNLGLGTFGILGNYLNPVKKLKDRIGAFADKILGRKKKESIDTPPVIVDNGDQKKELPIKEPTKQLPNKEKPIAGYLPTPEEAEEIKKRIAKRKEEKAPVDDKYGYGKLLADEYKIIYGVDPQVVDRGTPEKPDKAYKSWIDYNNRVDAERQATGRDINMYDFLTERREKLDGMIAGLGDTHTTTVGVARDNRGVGAQDKTDGHNQPKNEISSKADYEKHKDNPAMAAVIADARQSMMQSNLTSDNYNHKVTLTHFMDYLGENLTHSSFVADGTRDITKNPTLKRDIQRQEGENRHFVADLNEFYFPQKEDTISFEDKRKQIMVNNKENQEKGFWPTAKEVVGKMKEIFTNNHRNDPLYQRAINQNNNTH